MNNKLFLKVYIGFGLVYLLMTLLELETISWYLKPFLLPFLLLGVYFNETFSSKKLLLTAILFSWIGDIILLFSSKGEIYFIMGLVAFLISHVVYIFVFTNQKTTEKPLNKSILRIGIGLICSYLFLMVLVLFPKLGALKLPVLVYAIVISSMLLVAFKGSLSWKKPAGTTVLLGAILFVSSDSILAFNKFYQTIPFNSFLIMSTYIAAQYLIVNGILKLNQKSMR